MVELYVLAAVGVGLLLIALRRRDPILCLVVLGLIAVGGFVRVAFYYNEKLTESARNASESIQKNQAEYARKAALQLQKLDAAIAKDPKESQPYVDRAKFFLTNGRNEEALADCQRYVRLAPRNPHSYYSRAYCELMLDNYQACIGDCDRAVKLDGSNSDVLLLRATAILDLAHGSPKFAALALADCNEAIRQRPKDIPAHVLRAQIYQQMNRLDLAAKDRIVPDYNSLEYSITYIDQFPAHERK